MRNYKLILTSLLLAVFAAVNLRAQIEVDLSDSDLKSIKAVNRKTVSVHDPSVVRQSSSFYIIGTMRGWAKSTNNMKDWTALDNSRLFGRINSGSVEVCSFEDAFSVNQTKTVSALVGEEIKTVSFGNFDAKAWANADQSGWNLDGNMWAPDLIYNSNSKKWMMYFSLNGDDWHSCIVLLTADVITGPYVYQGPVHYSGFINDTNPVISYKLTDLEVAIGEQDNLPARYHRGNSWGQYWSNDIDPCVFFDEDGELWMTYGSWSGGIFMLKMDKQTGLRDYTVSYPYETDDKGRALSDPYFGKRIAGGYYSSGEGSYIQHIGNYYYLFISYGGYAPNGGYEMRTFRSSTPDGPYFDAGNRDACFHNRAWQTVGPSAETDGGMKLLGAYNKWGLQTVGECAQGHNSAIMDNSNRNFVVYHTKFNNGTDGHEVRTRQLFLNEDGWLCAAPFQFDNERFGTKYVTDELIRNNAMYTAEEMTGEYKMLIHKYRMDFTKMEEVTPITVRLSADGKVSGSHTGTWAMTEGSSYITLTLGGIVYKGVVVPQVLDGSNIPVIGITATTQDPTNSGVQLWAYSLDPRKAIAFAAKMNEPDFKDGDVIRQNSIIPATAYLGATVKWTTSNASAFTSKGVYGEPEEETPVTMTRTITCGDYILTTEYHLIIAAASDLPEGDYLTGCVAHYPFTSKATPNQLDKTQKATFKQTGSGVAATCERETQRNNYVLHQTWGDKDNLCYTVLPNPLQTSESLTGATISFWLKMASENFWDCIWSFTDKEGNDASQRLYMTGNAYFGYNDGGSFKDINHPDVAVTGYLPADEWAYVTAVITTSGLSLYVNGVSKASKSNTGNASFTSVMNLLRTAPYMQLGAGSFWGSAPCYIDDLVVYKRALSSKDVKLLYIIAGRKNPDFTAINDLGADRQSALPDAVFDLGGRQVAPMNGGQYRPGVYIVNGRKVLVK